ncbi:DUF1980 domain-containing protein [Neobacillus niacini]|nr:DUF1980 domain-containing protein [Neobacillus niacini]MCM3767574.1 DUF1980 domain-containing protein [Neobacillus niacini]
MIPIFRNDIIDFTGMIIIAYLVIVFPLITGFLLPSKVLDASM